MRRCLIFDPGLAALGGGERYAIALGEVVAETHDVIFAAPTDQLPTPEIMAQSGLPTLNIITLAPDQLATASVDYDLAVALLTQPVAPLFAAHNLVVIQFPFTPLPVGRLRRWLAHHELNRCDRIVYSQFARCWLLQRWRIDADVLTPGIDLPRNAGLPAKENLILSVGRFFHQMHSKRQDVLVEAFARLPEQYRKTWHLKLVGGFQPSPENDAFVERVRNAAQGLSVSIELNAPAERLIELQDRARFFWHATGFGRKPEAPERAEHFGLSTLEAMSHGAIPLVFADGGQPEVVAPEVGVLWRTLPQLVDGTVKLMACSLAELDARGYMSRAASEQFSIDRFKNNARELLSRNLSRPSQSAMTRRVLASTDLNARRIASLARLGRARAGRLFD